MNRRKHRGLLSRVAYRWKLASRRLTSKSKCKSFGKVTNESLQTIEEIYVINLDRQVQRWMQMQNELCYLTNQEGKRLSGMTKRFSAMDAKNYTNTLSCLNVKGSYALKDQLFVEPQPSLVDAEINRERHIEMSRQEIAVALSHIAVWELVANGDSSYVLILEDDVYFSRDFALLIDQIWADLIYNVGRKGMVDLVYLSYKEAKGKAEKEHVSEYLFRPLRGLWYLSGYVLSKKGANKLLDLLPVYGPVDLWMNHQFCKLDVFATSKSLIEQRSDYKSENSYSILPVLSKLGLLTQEGPSTFEKKVLQRPVFAIGRTGTGILSLAMALSMLGYRCCSNINELPRTEHENLFLRKRGRIFDAYVNVGSVEVRFVELARVYRNARLIITVRDEEELNFVLQNYANESRWSESLTTKRSDDQLLVSQLVSELQRLSVKFLILPATERNMWGVLCEFLACDPPVSKYPSFPDSPQRQLTCQNSSETLTNFRARKLRFDKSPWIATPVRNWQGIPLEESTINSSSVGMLENWDAKFVNFDHSRWRLLDDTFPSNLALFRQENFSIAKKGYAVLSLRREGSYVRDYTSAAIGSRKKYLYGKFEVAIRPSKAPGVITGVFLHRNSPRQEIDIEFLGKDTRNLLVNVYYNPGSEGTKFDFGYRGTPALIDLGFDASKDFHRYSIEWNPATIRWCVDGQLIHERSNWGPTPIPHLPMQFYINLWPSRSRELTGKLSDIELPTQSEIKSIMIQAQSSQ